MLNWEDNATQQTAPAAGGSAADANLRPASGAFADAAIPTPADASQYDASRRVKVADKRIINGQTDVNQLVPFK